MLRKIAITLTVVFAVSIAVTRFGANHQPDDHLLDSLHFDECQFPCWIGIEPGKTGFDEALAKLTAHFPDPLCARRLTCQVAIKDGQGLGFVEMSFSATETVTSISLNFSPNQNQVRVGDLAELMGQPSYFWVPIASSGKYWGPFGIEFDKPDSHVYIVADPKKLYADWNAPVFDLYLAKEPMDFSKIGFKLAPWAGARSFVSYWCSVPSANGWHFDVYYQICPQS